MNDHEPEEMDERTLRDLARLADGELDGRRREQLERRISSSPELAAAFARQRTALVSLRSLELEAPVGLRQRVEAERERPSRRVRGRRFAWGGALAGAAAAALLAAVLVLPSGGGGPTVVEAAELTNLPATQASVAVDPANPRLLAAEEDDVPFPNLEREFGWKEAGARPDDLDGRGTNTVFYERGGKRIGYTIVSGEKLGWPEGSKITRVNGVELRSTASGSQQIVTWLRDGRTCVLSGKGVGPGELETLASWKGEGTIPF